MSKIEKALLFLFLLALTAGSAVSLSTQADRIDHQAKRIGPTKAAGPVVVPLSSRGGKEWEIRKTDGAVRPEANKDYLSALDLRFADGRTVRYQSALAHQPTRLDADLAEQNCGGLRVSRKIHISRDGSYVRWLNVFRNDTDLPISFDAKLEQDLRTGKDLKITAGENRNLLTSRVNRWLLTAPSASSPNTLGHVLQGRLSEAPVVDVSTSVSLAGLSSTGAIEEPGWTYRVTLAPGRTGIVMNFAAAGTDSVVVLAKTQSLAELKSGALSGLSREERSQVLNFSRDEMASQPMVTILTPVEDTIISGPTPMTIRVEYDKPVFQVYMCEEWFVGEGADKCEVYNTIYSDRTPRTPPFEVTATINPDDFGSDAGRQTPFEFWAYASVWAGDDSFGDDEHRIYFAPSASTSPMSVRFVTPIDGQRVSSTIPIEVDIASTSNIAKAEFFVDGQKRDERTFSGLKQVHYSSSLDTSAWAPGSDHQLTVSSTDAAGKTGLGSVTITMKGVRIDAQGRRIQWGQTDIVGIQFTVQNPDGLAVDEFVLYRKDGGGSFQIIDRRASASELHAFIDLNLARSETYTYYVAAMGSGSQVLGRSADIILQ